MRIDSGEDRVATIYIIDRIEGGEWAVLEDVDGRTFPVPRFWLPKGAREGDALRISRDAESEAAGQANLRIEVDPEERRSREEAIARVRDRLTPGPSGDLEL